jgi:hypothetical protein
MPSRKGVKRMNILGLDLALHTGWCASTVYGKKLEYGCEDWTTIYHEQSIGQMFNDFEIWVDNLIKKYDIQLIAQEYIPYHMPASKARDIMVGQQTCVLKKIASSDINITYVSPQSIRKFATGRGWSGKRKQSKKDMMFALNQKFGLLVTNDNTCDAIWIVKYVEQEVL